MITKAHIKKGEDFGDDIDIEGYKITTYSFGDGSLNLYYSGNITRTFVQDIVAVLDDYEYEKFRLIINSPGGDATPIKFAPLVFKQCGLFEIITVSQCSSAALAICLYAKKLGIPVYADDLTHIVLHKSSQTELLEGRYARIDKFNENLVKKFETLFDKINQPIISKLSAEEKNNYKNGHNVYLLGDDVIKWGVFLPIDPKAFKYVKPAVLDIEEEDE